MKHDFFREIFAMPEELQQFIAAVLSEVGAILKDQVVIPKIVDVYVTKSLEGSEIF